jgi:RNA polymerase sigma-70 factor (ECF subfamily)
MQAENKKSIVSKWVELYSDSMFTWAFSRTSRREVAEDLVQDTFVAALHGFDKYEELSNPKTWLFSILNHKIIDYHRNHFRKQELIQVVDSENYFRENGSWKQEEMPHNWQDDEANLLDNAEFRQILEKCMNKLPVSWFSIVQMKYLEGNKSEEICQDLGITITNLWQVIHRSKLQLRKCIEINWLK